MQESELVRARESAVRRCLAAGASRYDAEDCAQDALLALLTDPEAAGAKSAAAWTATVAYRRYVDLLRRRNRERVAVIRLGDEKDRTTPELDEAITDRAMASWLIDALRQLPVTTHVVCLSTGWGVQPESVARQFGLTRRSVQSHLTRARRWLRRAATHTLVLPWLVVAVRRFPGKSAPDPVGMAAVVAVTAVALAVPLPFVQQLTPGAPRTDQPHAPLGGPSPDHPRPGPGDSPSAAPGHPRSPAPSPERVPPSPERAPAPEASPDRSATPLPLDDLPLLDDPVLPPLPRLPEPLDPDLPDVGPIELDPGSAPKPPPIPELPGALEPTAALDAVAPISHGTGTEPGAGS
ncbi:sigma-70 family RNA polymerase sigma factor [Micromonospora sp. B11E3]|uniref:sigma-70 family RNA polymerase sigma factor n=1 Tax=Micromonospora sp. B11E3 TaxID=3153562 RepID=UPI00325DD572